MTLWKCQRTNFDTFEKINTANHHKGPVLFFKRNRTRKNMQSERPRASDLFSYYRMNKSAIFLRPLNDTDYNNSNKHHHQSYGGEPWRCTALPKSRSIAGEAFCSEGSFPAFRTPHCVDPESGKVWESACICVGGYVREKWFGSGLNCSNEKCEWAFFCLTFVAFFILFAFGERISLQILWFFMFGMKTLYSLGICNL